MKEARKCWWEGKVTIKNCKKEAIISEKLQVKLALPSKMLIKYLEITNKLTLIYSCELFGNVFESALAVT